ncbi:hypothetical protein OBBRIDRAFT_798308 [Obba rivulosa]|uniref:Uncharacterized protein n=1 Tax=Obba rivulosa TaxID=1052685 RepID=A0A8E2AL20_9APHY|nr:hypothetical protein OBBRIDRAFT_798308 [Obba rivulosa]
MALRRFAQANSAASPRPSSSAPSPFESPTTPSRTNTNGAAPLSTPRTRIVYPYSPASSPSLSASVPFDWEAARSRRPPPYATPVKKGARGRKSELGVAPGTPLRTPAKRVVRKRTLAEKITSLPSQIAFELALFPHNVPLPAPRTAAWLLGGAAHVLHLCVRVAQIRKVPDSDLGWEDMYREGQDESWFDWTVPMTALLLGASVLNALYLFSRRRTYQLNLAPDPVASPNAKFVSRTDSPAPSDAHELPTRRRLSALLLALLGALWRALVASVRFLLNIAPPVEKLAAARMDAKVQALEVWTPGEMELSLFTIYSPVHALLWLVLTSANWMLVAFVMLGMGMQMRALMRAYTELMKDKAIIAAEVMHEYDEKFVYPRVNPIRKDASVMTHEAELVGNF